MQVLDFTKVIVANLGRKLRSQTSWRIARVEEELTGGSDENFKERLENPNPGYY